MTWTQRSGFSFGTFQERQKFDQALPVTGDGTYEVISGSLPPGLRISGKRIIGSPYEVARETIFTFCIRETNGTTISDRTYKITIAGADAPIFVTAAGSLDLGSHHQYYVMDSSYIDYQIQAFDSDTGAGQHLSYFIATDDGELPPGIILTSTGRLVGFVQPALSIRPEDGTGTYDNGYYDSVAYDFAYRPTNGYDSFIYDSVFFDYNLPSFVPKKLNRNYEFIVSITDGDSVAQRKFAIFVVGDDYFRADNTSQDGIFTADVTYLRDPVWITASNLGTHRANNYITEVIQVYDSSEVVVLFKDATDAWAQHHDYKVNDLILVSGNSYICVTAHNSGTSFDTSKWATYALPPGMVFDPLTSNVYGRVPYQPAITKTYRFTLVATRFGKNLDSASTERTFVINIVGEVDSAIKWNTDSNLGTIHANYISNLNVQASSTINGAVVLYTLTSGRLPPGLSLDLDGEIVGKVNQWGELNKPGLTRFFDQPPQVSTKKFSLFDGGATTVDRSYTFTVQARDQYSYSATSKTFTITVDTPNEISYSNIKTKPFLSLSQRAVWKDFISNTSIFTPGSIYRTNDVNFGVQAELAMLVYAGIETKESAAYIGAMGLNHKRKRFQFGSVTWATAVEPGTTTPVYEVVYINMIDPLEPNGKRLPGKIEHLGKETETISADSSTSFWSRKIGDLTADAPFAVRPTPIVTVDSTGYEVSNPNATTYFPNSISNWQDRLKAVGLTERNYLPLWMRSIPLGKKEELGFTLAVPLCYCKVGTAADIVLNIKHSGFDFKLLDYTADRYIIDSVTGDASDKYLVFRNDRITV